MRHFSVMPALTLKGRTFHGLRGFAGKPFHPPLTDFPVAAYVFAAVSLLAALTGWADWHRSSTPGTQARRTINTHALIMIVVTVLALVDIAARLTVLQDRPSSPLALAALSVVIAVLVSTGAGYGGSLVYDYGFNVETAVDSPVWHPNERDVLPGQNAPADTTPAPAIPATGDPSRSER